MSSPQSYNQTILLDCNRLSSEEYSASNLAQTDNAIFTNKVSNGITLNVGDQVSIQSAHIAQRGAGGSVIQMDGKTLGKKKITYTKTTNSSFVGHFKIEGSIEDHSPTGYAYETSENVEEEVAMKDNEATIVFEYYKTANGENNITLPRNYGMTVNYDSDYSGQPKSGSAGTKSASYWNASDNYGIGLNTYFQSSSHTFTPDYFDGYEAIRATNACNADCIARKLKQDNSKYTLFKMNKIVWVPSRVSLETKKDYLQPRGLNVDPDPAICGYNRYREKVKLSIDAGYNSPSSIATTITDELVKSETPYVIINSSGSIVVNSTAYKAFPAANSNTFNAENNKYFFNASLIDGLPVGVNASSDPFENRATYYLNNYAYVGFKRPDFVEAGREFTAYHGNEITSRMLLSGSGSAIIYTNISYNDDVLSKMKRFLDSQILYPELLDHAADATKGITNYSNFNTTSASLNGSFREEARFIHCQVSASNLGSAVALGDDLYNVSYSTTTEKPPSQRLDTSTVPLFFYFNKNSSHLTATETTGDSNHNLAYGFARKYKSGAAELVALITQPIGGIPASYYGHQGGEIDVGTKLGYDYHFNAYGNSALILSNGYHGLQYYGYQSYVNNQLIKEIYLGANNILFNFNTVESRFELSNLHSAEKVGNFYNAGDPSPPSGVLAPPSTAQAGLDCYKINKPLRYDTWTPTMQPYPLIDVTGSFTTGTQNSFIDMNSNLLQSTVYDAHGGISIVDMGITEDKWKESIWGLLGFEYGQFNASGNNIVNINNRFTNDNPNSSGITTNALISSENSLQFSQNVFGTNLFNPNINDDIDYYNTVQNRVPPVFGGSFTVPPPIIVTGDDLSTKIIANKLPRKLLRGYFLINSDILDSANYYQLANPLQTMAVVGKYNAANDFVNYDGGGAVFTVTRQKTITSIKTQILDPEASLAQVGDNSGVIYRIDKQIKTDLNFAENLMAGAYGKPPS